MKAPRGFRNSLWGLSFLLFLKDKIQKRGAFISQEEELWEQKNHCVS
jgi:hypothetical protein